MINYYFIKNVTFKTNYLDVRRFVDDQADLFSQDTYNNLEDNILEFIKLYMIQHDDVNVLVSDYPGSDRAISYLQLATSLMVPFIAARKDSKSGKILFTTCFTDEEASKMYYTALENIQSKEKHHG